MRGSGASAVDAAALRAAARRSVESADFTAADATFARLRELGALEPADAREWVASLRSAGAVKEPGELQRLVDDFPDDQDIVEFVAAELWQRAAATGIVEDAELARQAWGTALRMVGPGPRTDAEGRRMIGLLDRFYRAGRRASSPVGSYQEFEQALVRFAAAGPESTLLAADLLAGDNPGLALDLIAQVEASSDAVLVSAVAACELDDFAGAVARFDELAAVWGRGARSLELEDRSRWIQAMTDVGRFAEADAACSGTLAALDDRSGAGEPWALPGREAASPDHWRHTFHLLAYRLASQQGRYADGWEHLRASQAVDETKLESGLQRSILRVRLLLVGRDEAEEILERLRELDSGGPYDTTYAEACLWVSAQWGNTADDLGVGVSPRKRTADVFGPPSAARYRGQAAARELLTRADRTVSSRQKVRLALLAGDDDLADRLLAAVPLTADDPWTVKVLAAMLALRNGFDLTARRLLEEVLPQRRHDLDLRVLDAQAYLIAGDYRLALRESMAITEAVGGHVLARTIQAEAEFEAALAMADDFDGNKNSVENVQQLMLAVADYRQVADTHLATRTYLLTGGVPDGVGSEPLTPRLFAEICRRGLHAAILAQESMDRLGLRADAKLVDDAQDLLQHLRGITRPCCRRLQGTRWRRLLHQVRHLPERDEASRLAALMISYRWSRWTTIAQNLVFFVVGGVIAALALWGRLPGPESDTIRVTVLALGVLLMLMPFARNLKVGVVELSREESPAPLSGRSKSLRTSRLLLRAHHLGTFAPPSPPDKGRRARQRAEDAAGLPASVDPA
ncbi:MAG: hypothetical protein AAGC63_02985 [Propionicimonas sp.]